MADPEIVEITMGTEGGVALAAVQDVPLEQRAQLVRDFLKKGETTSLSIEDVANLIGYVTPIEEKSAEEKSAEGHPHGASIREFDDSIVIEVFAKAGIDISKLGYDQAYILFSSMSPQQLRIAFRELVDKDVTTLLNFSNLLNRAVRDDLMSPETVKDCKNQDKDNDFKMAEGRNATAMAIIRGVAAIMPNRYFDEGAIGYALLESIALKAVAAYGADAKQELGEVYELNFASLEDLREVAPFFVEQLDRRVVGVVVDHIMLAQRNKFLRDKDRIKEQEIIRLLKVFQTRDGQPNYLWRTLTKQDVETGKHIYQGSESAVYRNLEHYVTMCVNNRLSSWTFRPFEYPFALGEMDVLPDIAHRLNACRNQVIAEAFSTRFNDPREGFSLINHLTRIKTETLEEAFKEVIDPPTFEEIPESLVELIALFPDTATAFSTFDRLCFLAQKFGVPKAKMEEAVFQFYELILTKDGYIVIPLTLRGYDNIKSVVGIDRTREYVAERVGRMLFAHSPQDIGDIVKAGDRIRAICEVNPTFLNQLKQLKHGEDGISEALLKSLGNMIFVHGVVMTSDGNESLKARYRNAWREKALSAVDVVLFLISSGIITDYEKGYDLVGKFIADCLEYTHRNRRS